MAYFDSKNVISGLAVLAVASALGCPTPEPNPDASAPTSDAFVEPGSDAASDTRPADAAIARCVQDRDCDDATFCNGVEECRPSDPSADARGCVDAPDGAPCLETQTCDEDADACRTDCARTGDADGDGVISIDCGTGTDCDDANSDIYPGAPEVCDDVDQDCDPSTLGTRDIDGDGAVSAACCNASASGAVRCGPDCNDANRAVGPAMVENCDAYDNDCDGMTDEGVTVAGFLDADGDQHGDPRMMADSCLGFARFSLLSDDCDDANPARHGGQVEVCNMLDDDCDIGVDEQTASVAWYVDNDGDGFGAALGSTMSCTPIAGRSLLSTDCDDTDAAVHPGLIEACNAVDDNCDGRLEYRIARNDFEDDDADHTADAHCGMGAADCDDGDPAVFPDALEREEGADNDCDGSVDEGCSGAPYYVDADDDGYGIEAGVMSSCTPIAGRVTRAGDCNDSDVLIHPRARETCDGVDEDCNGSVDDFASLVCGDSSTLGSCRAGGCAVASCEQNSGNCNGNASDGCERDLASDLANCGGCGVMCTATGAHRLPLCEAGHCTGTCEVGFGDCNGAAADGCELDVRNDAANCGACGRSCAARDGTSGRCEMGACAFACLTGRRDCDRDLTNGCEVSSDRDPMNCGVCGVVCGAGSSCIGGACVSSPPGDFSVSTTPTESLGDYAVPGGRYLIPSGRHDFDTLTLPAGQTIVATGSGVLDIRVRGEIRIEGTIDLSGGRGSNCGPIANPPTWANGGSTGTATDGVASTSCGVGGGGGVLGVGGDSESCTNGGRYGGGSVGSLGGGGGGGCAGGGGGSGSAAGGAGGACPGETAARGAYGVSCEGGAESLGPPYWGTHTVSYYSGCGGSIGVVAASDLAVASTFRPGSGGGAGVGVSSNSGAGGAAGGGGGGALRLVSLTRIVITPTGRVLANGGAGGIASGTGADGGGGGGSGGVIVLAAPSVQSRGTMSAMGGLGGRGGTGDGGNGGLGRIRISTYLDQCELGLSTPSATCVASPPGGLAGTAFVASYPN